MFKYLEIVELLEAKFLVRMQECLYDGWELTDMKMEKFSGFYLLKASFKKYEKTAPI